MEDQNSSEVNNEYIKDVIEKAKALAEAEGITFEEALDKITSEHE